MTSRTTATTPVTTVDAATAAGTTVPLRGGRP